VIAAPTAFWDTIKLVPLVFVLAVFQVTSTPMLGSFASGPDLVLVVVVALTLWRGTVTGAVTGFFGGLLLDAMVFTPLGIASLLYVLAAALVGRGIRHDDSVPGPPAPRAGAGSSLRLVPWVVAASLSVQIGDSILHVILGSDIPLAYVWWNQILPSVIQTGLAACVMAPILRWMFPPEFVRDAGIATA
jgi:cell shape-determining protein MreD